MTEENMTAMDDTTVDNVPMPTDEDMPPELGEHTLDQLLKEKAEAMASADRVFNTMKAGKKFDRKDVMKVLYGFRKAILISDQLLDLTIQDLMVVDQRFGNLEQQLFQMVQQVSTVTTTLFNKNVITKQDVTDTWEKEIKPAVQEKLKAVQDKMAGIAKPEEELSPVLGPDGTPANSGVDRIVKP